MLKKIEKERKEEILSKVEANIDRELYNCEISEQILDRIRQETTLVKERVKEI